MKVYKLLQTTQHNSQGERENGKQGNFKQGKSLTKQINEYIFILEVL